MVVETTPVGKILQNSLVGYIKGFSIQLNILTHSGGILTVCAV